MGLKDIHALGDFNQGAVGELFGREWPKLLENIADPSTEAKARRKVTIEITVIPSEDRSSAKVLLNAKSTLAQVKADESVIFMELTGKGVVAMAREPEQQILLDNILNMKQERKA